MKRHQMAMAASVDEHEAGTVRRRKPDPQSRTQQENRKTRFQ